MWKMKNVNIHWKCLFPHWELCTLLFPSLFLLVLWNQNARSLAHTFTTKTNKTLFRLRILKVIIKDETEKINDCTSIVTLKFTYSQWCIHPNVVRQSTYNNEQWTILKLETKQLSEVINFENEHKNNGELLGAYNMRVRVRERERGELGRWAWSMNQFQSLKMLCENIWLEMVLDWLLKLFLFETILM